MSNNHLIIGLGGTGGIRLASQRLRKRGALHRRVDHHRLPGLHIQPRNMALPTGIGILLL